jgi:antitoxin component of MazEF toxin-antitoxin module
MSLQNTLNSDRRARLFITSVDIEDAVIVGIAERKAIATIGTSPGIIFDVALMDLARLKVGDQVAITVQEGGSIVLTPVRPKKSAATARRLIRKNARLFRRLA